MLRKLNNEIELLKHELSLQQKDYDRKMEYERELTKRREEWLHIEASKLKHIVHKYRNE